MSKVEIRIPKLEDIMDIHRLFRVVIEDTFNKEGLSYLKEDIEMEIDSKIKYLDQSLKRNGESRFFLLAVNEDKIIGTIEYGPSSQLINELTKGELKTIVEMGTVFVDPTQQRNGIGRMLFRALLLSMRANGIDEFCLDSGYRSAQKYWTKKLGQPDFVYKSYWGDENDHMIWRRKTIDILDEGTKGE
ncbi:GNAT family N-acetyltransferase [Bacillus horti]|nr:GNAT family N-acetyltransferase [Bacillus horti]